MLQITIPSVELWDEKTEQFIKVKGQTLTLEHSLVSLSKWESKWCKPFVSKNDLTYEEMIDYVRCMTLTQNVDPAIYKFITKENIEQVNQYIGAPMTATTFRKDQKTIGNKEQVTAELIYYWMIALNIPFECQKWHLNRLITLIEVCSIKNTPPKKMSKRDLARRHAAINAANRKRYHSKG